MSPPGRGFHPKVLRATRSVGTLSSHPVAGESNYRAGDPHRHEHLDAFAYSSTDISGPFSPPSPS
eukprot:1114771-Pyramimonas_sp.AAC.1